MQTRKDNNIVADVVFIILFIIMFIIDIIIDVIILFLFIVMLAISFDLFVVFSRCGSSELVAADTTARIK